MEGRACPDQGHKLWDVICSIPGTRDRATKEMKLKDSEADVAEVTISASTIIELETLTNI